MRAKTDTNLVKLSETIRSIKIEDIYNQEDNDDNDDNELKNNDTGVEII